MPQLREHSTIVRMSDTALYACNNCGSSMLQPIYDSSAPPPAGPPPSPPPPSLPPPR